MTSSLNLNTANVGNTPTFDTPTRSSVVDITFYRGVELHGWHVATDTEIHSDHRYIFFELEARVSNNTDTEVSNRWVSGKLDRQALTNYLRSNEPAIPDQADSANTTAVALCDYLVEACDSCMPRRRLWPRRRPVHWWMDEIAGLRRGSIVSYRAFKRAIRSKAAMNTTSIEPKKPP